MVEVILETGVVPVAFVPFVDRAYPFVISKVNRVTEPVALPKMVGAVPDELFIIRATIYRPAEAA